jgi:ABC-type transport system involved in multi-copper enzyme maturation permease subunit
MPVYDQNYRPWKGRLLPYPRPWWVIAKTHIRLRWKRGVITLLILAAFPFLSRIFQILAVTRLADFNVLSDVAKTMEINAAFFCNFMQGNMFTGEAFWFVLMIILTGAGIIANDHKYKANQIYFSKPVTCWDYMAGKFMTVAFYGGLITVAPALFLFLLQILLAEDVSFIKIHYWIPLSIIGYGIIGLMVFGSIILALSAMVSNRSAGILFFALLVFPDIIRSILSGAPKVGLISIGANVKQVGAAIFGLDPPYDFSVWAAGAVLLGVVLACLFILRWRIRPSEVIT